MCSSLAPFCHVCLVKIFNDPVHGFIEVPTALLPVLDHPVVQRLRRIKQMGGSSLVYSGAEHTRFSHAMGAMHLTRQALDTLRQKGHEISHQEYLATLAAILLHDVGHGPFSHALETVLVPGMHHERLSRALIQRLSGEIGEMLPMALQIFDGSYPRRFLHQLISGQLDMDRMDYLVRDSFFTGVIEGSIGADRIIKTLDLARNEADEEVLVVEEKGIYSVEQFLVARRVMYWQVYFHKTALAAECMLSGLLGRVRTVYQEGAQLYLPEHLRRLLSLSATELAEPGELLLDTFLALDDHDIWYAIKQWALPNSPAIDPVVAELSSRLLTRRLLKLRFRGQPVPDDELAQARSRAIAKGFAADTVAHFVFAGTVQNEAYRMADESILIRYKDGSLRTIIEASDLENLRALAEPVTKYYLVQPK